MSSIKGNSRSFIFDKTRTITFWAKDNQGETNNEVGCIVGSINSNREVDSFSEELIALSSTSYTSFLLTNNKEFIFEKISNNSFIIVTYEKFPGSAGSKIYYRVGTLNGLLLSFDNQVVIETEVYGETIRPVVIDGNVFIFYTDGSVLYSYNIQTESETEYDVSLGNIKLDVSILGSTIILVGYSGSNSIVSPRMAVGTYENGEFAIVQNDLTNNTGLLNTIKIAHEFKNIEGVEYKKVLSSVFFTEPGKFFLVAIPQSAAVPV